MLSIAKYLADNEARCSAAFNMKLKHVIGKVNGFGHKEFNGMVKDFIDKNKKIIGLYGTLSRIIGWALVVMGVFGGIAFAMDVIKFGGNLTIPATETAFMLFKRSWFSFFIPGLIALGAAQFIAYLLTENSKPGLLLRHADKVLYVYAVLVTWGGIGGIIAVRYFNTGYTYPFPNWLVFYVLPVLVLTAGKILILISLAQLLRRILPIIHESKTLV